jgi:predicted short-subunit dehydrogenase-like oxidoreductase (DUF2520 family)
MNITIVGSGHAGTAFSLALRRAGHHVDVVHHGDAAQLRDADTVLLCVPDDHVATMAMTILPTRAKLVAHVSGSLGLDVLAPHENIALMHPLAVLVNEEVGARRLVGANYSVAGSHDVLAIVRSLQGRVLHLRDDQRAAYHAAAAVSANHLVALMAHVDVIARSVGLTVEDFLPLAHMALEDVASMGVERALTGPASRGDDATIAVHRAALLPSELALYDALSKAARSIAHHRTVASGR